MNSWQNWANKKVRMLLSRQNEENSAFLAVER